MAHAIRARKEEPEEYFSPDRIAPTTHEGTLMEYLLPITFLFIGLAVGGFGVGLLFKSKVTHARPILSPSLQFSQSGQKGSAGLSPTKTPLYRSRRRS